jgi:Domain of unknown function (DUF4352)
MMRRTTSHNGRTTLGAGAVIIAAGLALTACSSAQPTPGKASPAFTSLGSGPVGATFSVSDSSGTKLDVTVEKVIDPASGANKYTKSASGKHFIGVQLRVHNAATTAYQNNANNETTIVLSNRKTRDAAYNPIAGCGNFDNGQIKLATGASGTGCVTFQVPNGDKVAAVRYGNTVYPGTAAEWRLP